MLYLHKDLQKLFYQPVLPAELHELHLFLRTSASRTLLNTVVKDFQNLAVTVFRLFNLIAATTLVLLKNTP